MDGQGHLLSLKVMRISRPALASAWQPFYSSSPSFSAHSTASILSLQGKDPLPDHPKTLRDLTHATELLTLPSSFGAIQLGETFSSCLCVNNEAHVDIEGVTLRVEMQTISAKLILTELGGSECQLAAGDTMEGMVHHEIKELGQHVLACTVSYRSPPNARHGQGAADDTANDPTIQTFRKFYKFAVTNPLSVKTKVHIPRSPSALLSATEREKVFLEVHIQNLTQESMWFERMRFECTGEWLVVDGNLIEAEDGEESESLFSDSTALMQPQDMRQYMYILSPKQAPSFPVSHPPGTIIPLGRLDISWRSSYGEPGRLLTSMLTRRIPLPALVQQPVSALPLYLQRNPAVPSRPHSPSQAQPRPATPPATNQPVPYRPGSPLRSRPTSIPSRPQSPGPVAAVLSPTTAQPTQAPALPAVPSRVLDIDVDVVVKDIPRDQISIEKPFNVLFGLTVSAAVPRDGRRRIVSLVVQHLQPPRIAPTPPEAFSPRLPSSGFSTPSPSSTPIRSTFNYVLAEQKLLVASPRQQENVAREGQTSRGQDVVVLPPPFLEGEESKSVSRRGVVSLGPSTLSLDPIKLALPAKSAASSEPNVKNDLTEPDGVHIEDNVIIVEAVQEFELTYMPLRKGFVTAGGLRILLVKDQVAGENADGSDASDVKTSVSQGRSGAEGEGGRKQRDVRTLKELDVVGEFWVHA